MENPEKLYIEKRKHRYDYLTACVKKNYDNYVEYVRTDVFVEKATKLFEENLKKIGLLKDEREPMINNFKRAMNNEDDND